jgi:hypothetical protein
VLVTDISLRFSIIGGNMFGRIAKFSAAAIVVAGIGACNDTPKPTEPAVANRASAIAAPSTGKSTVCAMYQTKLSAARNALSAGPARLSVMALKNAESDAQDLGNVVSDVCN